MVDKWSASIEKYDFTVSKTSRTKGAILLETNKGYFLLKEFKGSKKHLEFEESLLRELSEREIIGVDYPIRNKEDNLVSEDADGYMWIARKWYMAKDCDVRNTSNLYQSAASLAVLHDLANQIVREKEIYTLENETKPEEQENLSSLLNEYERHNRELRRTRNYIRSKRRKNEFELLILSTFDEFSNWAKISCENSKNHTYSELHANAYINKNIIHGSYNYHNIMFSEERCIIVNFEHAKIGIQIRDLYDFLRKVLEKHNWNYELGHRIIEEYDKVKTIQKQEMEYLKMRLTYPEKFWKILNHYYNNNKAWVPDKDIEKLKNIINQNKDKMDFINSI